MDAPVEAVEATEAVEAPTNVDALPDATEPSSFEASLEAAFANLDQAPAEPEPEPAAEPEPEPAAEPEPVAEESVEQDTGDQESDPIEDLSEDIGDDWTPKAANRFKELKTELKTNRSELEQLRQQSKEYESKIQELTGLVENKDVEQLQSKLEQTQAYQTAVSEPLAAWSSRLTRLLTSMKLIQMLWSILSRWTTRKSK